MNMGGGTKESSMKRELASGARFTALVFGMKSTGVWVLMITGSLHLREKFFHNPAQSSITLL